MITEHLGNVESYSCEVISAVEASLEKARLRIAEEKMEAISSVSAV